MATFTPVYLNSEFYFQPRALIQGVAVADVGATGASFVDGALTWSVGLVSATVTLQPWYFPFGSQWYNVQSVWDISACEVRVSGVPVDGGVFFYIDWTVDRRNLVQVCRLFGTTGDFQIFALPPAPANHWLQLPPLL